MPPLERWLGALDPRELRAPAVKRLAFEDWIVDVEAIALDDAAARACGCAQLVPRGEGGGAVDDVRPLRRKIKKKAARYGALDRPYLLAVLALGDRVRDADVERALHGAGPRDHAVWLGPGGPCNTRLSGVLVARGLRSTDAVRGGRRDADPVAEPVGVEAARPRGRAAVGDGRRHRRAARRRRLDWPDGQFAPDAVAPQGLPLQREGPLGARLQVRPAPPHRTDAAASAARRRRG